jgi:predicted ATP-dependent endonuclease of OLD family
MIKKLRLNSFTNFDDTTFAFSKGINIFIGKNGTGKTHILKALAATAAANNEFILSTSQAKDRFESIIADKLISYFKPEQLGRLVKRQQGRNTAKIEIDINGSELLYSFATSSKANVKIEKNNAPTKINLMYLPPREMFSLYEGFLGLVANREIAFDETYIMLAKALDAPILKGPRYEKTKDLIEPLEKALGIKVVKENGRFYIQDANGKMEAHLVAEGLRKLASVMYLIVNGELSKNSVLFWDEPESNLNPALIKVVAEFIKLLANQGVQLFVATHDYLLTQLLSLNAEYSKVEAAPDMKFFCLTKNESGSIEVEEGKTLIQINHNPILDEYAQFYDLEQLLFHKSLEKSNA